MSAFRRYVAVWRVPGAPVLLVFGLVARLSIAMTPLGLLLLVQQATGRYAAAALAGAVYTLGFAACSPVAGRVADRVGPSPVLLATALVHPFGLAALILAARGRAVVGVVAAAAFSGATYPPLVAGLRGAWSRLTEPEGGYGPLRETALASETALYQCVFIVGPLLVAGLVTIGSPALVIAASAAVTLVGTATLARGSAMRNWRPEPGRSGGSGPLRVPGFPAILACAAALGLAFGVVTVTLPAYATSHSSGSGALAGVFLAILSTGSVLGGIWFGARPHGAPLPRQFAALLGALAVGYASLALMPNPVAFAVALFCGGVLVAPALTVESALVGAITTASVRTEAYTWVVTVEVAATAVGIQVTGLIVDRPGGLPWAFLPASAAVALAAVVAARPAGSLSLALARPTP